MKQCGLIIAIILGLTACQSSQEKRLQANKIFIEKYGAANFVEFKGWEFTVRSFDNGNPIILVYDQRQPKKRPCDLAFGVTVDKQNHKIVNTNRDGIDDSCHIDEEVSKKLAVEFLKYSLFSLSVDTIGTVKVKTTFSEDTPDLIRFSDASLVPKDFMTKWDELGGGWYERKEKYMRSAR